jgi:NAD(P)-dependent dehydrogenase (short-subunit alcohol dehydrogenase family)
MSDIVAHIDLARTGSRRTRTRPYVLITGACRGVGRACAEAFATRGAELILCDIDRVGLQETADAIGATCQIPCDVASEASVATFAAEVLSQYSALDMVINAAGGGYERTLGMYRVSRALFPALRRGTHKLLVNIPPAPQDADTPTFPYASSRLAFQRLSAALALEARGTLITVFNACPAASQLTYVFPDPNAGTWSENCSVRQQGQENVRNLAGLVASLTFDDTDSRRQAS